MLYSIKTSDLLCEIGEYPQLSLSKTYTPNKGIHYSNLRWDILSEDDPNLEFELNTSARLTDILSNSITTFGLVVSEKLKQILEKTRLNEYKFYPVIVKSKVNTYKYYWFHYPFDFWKYVDFNNTSFLVLNKFSLNQLKK